MGKNTERIQAVLNNKYFRETDALKVRRVLVEQTANLNDDDENKWTDRKLITEGLIALGEKYQSGWSPPNVPNEMTISANVVSLLADLNKFADMLSNMDISQLRNVDGFNEETFETLKNEGLKTGAVRLFSEETTFDTEDW